MMLFAVGPPEVDVSNSIENKLRELNEATGETCSLIYDKQVDRWYVFYLKAIPSKHANGHCKYERRNAGCGATVNDALNDALREAGPLPLVPAAGGLFAT